MKKILLIIFLLPFLGFTQVTGDYRSFFTTGNSGSWTAPGSWQYYNGSSWVAATTYPGQNTGTGTVTIRDSHVITINTNITNSFTSLVIGSGTSGELVVNSDINVNTTSVSIMSNGTMSFASNKSITFPANSSFSISSGGRLYASSSNCSNQTALYIGSTKVSACIGNGGGAQSNFDSFSSGGGTGRATSNTPLCTGSQLVLTAIPPVASSGSYTYQYRWSGPGIYYNPDFSSSATYTINDVNISNHGGNYTVEIKRNDGFVSTVLTKVVVNPKTVGGGVNRSGLNKICINSSTGTMTLGNGYVGNVVRWEKRLNNTSIWTSIPNTVNITSYSEIPSSSGTWEYRALVASGSCSEVYSSSYSLDVNPELFITLGSSPEVTQLSTSTTLSYTANNGNEYDIVFDSAAQSADLLMHMEMLMVIQEILL